PRSNLSRLAKQGSDTMQFNSRARSGRTLVRYLLGAVIVLGSAIPAAADSVADFYKGRTVTIVVGASESGAFSIYARVLAEVLPQYIPGKPNIIVKSMPGAGGTVMANYMYNVAPKDGLTIGTPIVSMPVT